MSVTYNGYYGVQNPWKKIPLLNAREYIMLTNEAAINAGQSPYFSQAEIDGFTADTDWQDEMFNYNAPKMDHNLTFSGGGDKIEYTSTIGYFSQDGIVAKGKSYFDRITYRLNAAGTFGFFKLGGNINLANVKNEGIDANSHFGISLDQALNMPPIVPVKFSDGTWGTPESYGIGLQEITNPIALLSYTNTKTRTNKLIGNVFGEIDFGKITETLNLQVIIRRRVFHGHE
jgi:hypothetical protein